LGKAKSIALFVYSEPQTYPPTINAANILAEKGYQVYLYGIKYDTKDKVALHPDIKMHYWGKQEVGIKNVLKYASIYFRLLKDSIKYQFGWMIAYDAFAVGPAYFVAKLRNIKWVYHQHDWWEQPIGVFQKWVSEKEFQWGSKATVVSFPQEHRAKLFQEKTGMKNLPLIVYNGPRLSWIAKQPVIHPELAKIKKSFNQVLIYQGGLSVYFSLENLIRALPMVHAKVAILFLGRALDDRIEQLLQEIAGKEKVADQIFYWHEYVGYDDLPDITSFCDIGITKLTHNDMFAPVNDRFIAGASNKIAEYMAAGLPIISSDTDDNKQFYCKHEIGLLCDTTRPEAIANAINQLLGNKEVAMAMATRNRENFIKEYNFDFQFNKIEKIIAG
jgi:glycosyltransferase involved in cell wall biosynthesis